MPAVMGRPRRKDLYCPPGVRKIGNNYYWQPTSKEERERRKAAGLKVSESLGPDLYEARKRWAELNGLRKETPPAAAGTVAELLDRYEDDELEAVKSNGEPKRRPKTIKEYRRSLAVMRKEFGARKYARTEAEAFKAGVLTTFDVQQFVSHADAKVQANRHSAVLSDVFAFGRRAGLTIYNPVLGVEKNVEQSRDRNLLPWEREILLTAATPRMALMIRLVRIVGWREADIVKFSRKQCEADGVSLKQSKRGAKQIWAWTPELRAIVEEAKALFNHLTLLFPSEDGKQLTVSGFQSDWKRTVERANKMIAEAGDLPLITDLHFHDLRKRAINDAMKAGHSGKDFAGHSDERTVRDHYALDGVRVTPLA